MKHIRYISFLMLLFINVEIIAQTNRNYETNPDRKRAFNWLFGNKVWLDYNFNPPQFNAGSQLNALEAASSFSDTSGNLLFYSNGLTVWNNNHKVIINGTGLNGDNSSSQGVLFIKHPSIDSIVYIFTTDAQCGPKGLQVSIISIHPNIDSSIIIEKNRVLITPVCESISAIKHNNGKYVWITVHSKVGNVFYSFLISESGIVECPVVSNQGYLYDGQIFNCQTTSRFSSDGQYFAINMLNDFKVMLLRFDNQNGRLKLLDQFENKIIPTGLAFSNNDSMLYIIERSKQINQIKIINSQNNIVKTINNKFNIIQIEKSPNKEILVNVLDSYYLASILYPDSIGVKSNFNQRNYYLNGVRGKNGLCNFNQSYFHTPSIDFSYKFNCINNSIELEGRDTFYADSFNWRFKKVFGVDEQLKYVKKPYMTFADTGLYDIIFIGSKDSRSDTVIKQIYVYPKIEKDFLGHDSIYKSNIPFNLQLKTPYSMHCIRWHDSSTSETYTTDTAGTYFVQITNKAFCTVLDTIHFIRCINELNKPVLINIADTLRSHQAQADSFIWFRNNEIYRITKDSFIVLTDTGAFRVEAAKKGYCNNSSITIHYKCINNLTMPSIYLSRDTLFTYQSLADSFVWYRNNQLFQVTKQPFIKLIDTGTYRVEAARKLHCNRSSSNLHISNLNVNINLVIDFGIKIYPNPADESITFEIQETNGIKIRLYDAKGNLIYERYSNDLKTQMDISSLAQGLYVIELINEQTLYHSKILIQ